MTKFIRGQQLKTQTQKILYNIYLYFTNESNLFKKKENGYFQKVQKRVSDATAISKNTISKIINKTDEKGNPEFSIKGRRTKTLHLKLNQFDYSVIRNIVYEYHFRFKELPTMTSLKTKLMKSIKYEGSTATLRRILKDMGFGFRKIENNKHVLMEKHNIRLKRIRYLKEIKKFRNAGRNIVYMDEYCIDPKDIKKDAKSISKSDRVVLMHAGNEKGFITGAFMFQRCVDFKTDVNSDLFENWIRKYLIPNLPKNSVLVIDNAVYHNKLIEKPPNSYSTKAQMIAWLQKHNITYDPRLLKPELYNLIKNNKEKYSEFVIDRIMEENGHSVLRIPLYHPDFNPIENIWLQLKDDLIRRKVVMNYRNVKELVEEKVTKTGLDEWKIVCDRAFQCENDYRVIEPNIDGLTESYVIDICSTSEDSESDRSDSAWRDVESDSE